MEKAIIIATKAVCEAAVSITTIVVLSKLATKLFMPAIADETKLAKKEAHKYSL